MANLISKYTNLILINFIMLCSCHDRPQIGLLDHPRSKKIQNDSDIVYILKVEYPQVYNDIIIDGQGYYSGKVSFVENDSLVCIEFPRGVLVNDILTCKLIVYRQNTFVSKASFLEIKNKKLYFRLYDRSKEEKVKIGDLCQMKK